MLDFLARLLSIIRLRFLSTAFVSLFLFSFLHIPSLYRKFITVWNLQYSYYFAADTAAARCLSPYHPPLTFIDFTLPTIGPFYVLPTFPLSHLLLLISSYSPLYLPRVCLILLLSMSVTHYTALMMICVHIRIWIRITTFLMMFFSDVSWLLLWL